MSVIFTLRCCCSNHHLHFNNVMSNVSVKPPLLVWHSVCYVIYWKWVTQIYTRMIFLLAPLSFFFFPTGRITLQELPFCISCQFKCRASLPASLLSSSISFLCCTGAEHYVNLVIGTGPSPLYGFLLSRSTWLVKEDGMKINEVQLIQEGGYLSNTSTEEIAQTDNSSSPQLCCFSTPFFILPVLTRELWTFHLCSKATTASRFDWCRYSSQSFFPLNWKAQLSKIDFPAQFTLAASR